MQEFRKSYITSYFVFMTPLSHFVKISYFFFKLIPCFYEFYVKITFLSGIVTTFVRNGYGQKFGY